MHSFFTVPLTAASMTGAASKYSARLLFYLFAGLSV
jgi:hypothetical protein